MTTNVNYLNDTMRNVLLEKPIQERAVKISLEDYHEMGKHGIISERTELIRGVIVEKMSKSPLHTKIVQRLYRYFTQNLSDRAHVRQEQPLTISSVQSEPEPDIVVVEAPYQNFEEKHPGSASIVIEVSVSSLAFDRLKSSGYASANVRDYYLVNGEAQEVEHYSKPFNGNYTEINTLTKFDNLVFLIEGKEYILSVEELFK